MDTHYIKPSEESLATAMDKYTTCFDAKLQNVDHSVDQATLSVRS
jgi:hypothetical protein